MPKHTVNWVNDHTQICDRLDERVQLMQNYLDSKPDDFDGIAVKRFLLGQAREQFGIGRRLMPWIMSGVSRAVALWKAYNLFWNTISPPTASGKPSEAQSISAFPLLPKMWTRFDDEGYLDASEAGDDEIFDLR